MEYGQLTSNLSASGTSGIGTYHVYYSGSDIKVDLIPDAALTVDTEVSALTVSIASTQSTGIGTHTINTAIVDSSYTAIAASGSPTANVVAEYAKDLTTRDNDYSGAYYLVSVEDTTNNRLSLIHI